MRCMAEELRKPVSAGLATGLTTRVRGEVGDAIVALYLGGSTASRQRRSPRRRRRRSLAVAR